MSETILRVVELRKWFPLPPTLAELLTGRRRYVRAVDGISFTVKRGEFFCLVGESGCGKTTTGRLIVRAIRPTSGRILYKPSPSVLEEAEKLGYAGEEGFIDLAAKLPRRLDKLLRREIQMVFQDPYASLNPRQRVRDILMEPLSIHGLGSSRDERLEMACKVLEEVKLVPPQEFLERYPHQLSGGQRQRVVIARVLILGPRLVVADEPVSMLDVSIRAEILQLMLELKEKRGLSYIMVTHDLALAYNVCDRIAVMYLGKIVEEGSADQVVRNPLHPYTRALIAAIPVPDPSRRRKVIEVPIKGEVPSAARVPSGCRLHPRCPYATEICRSREPPLVEVEPGHSVACWLYAKA